MIDHPIKRYRRCAKQLVKLTNANDVIYSVIYLRNIKQQWLDYFKEQEDE